MFKSFLKFSILFFLKTLNTKSSISFGTPTAKAPGNSVLGIIVLDISFKKNASSSLKCFGFQSTFFEDGLQEFNNEDVFSIDLNYDLLCRQRYQLF